MMNIVGYRATIPIRFTGGLWATRTLLKFSVGLDKFHHLGQRTIPAPALNIRAVIAPHPAHPCSMSSRFFAPTRVSSSFHREFFRSNFAGNFSLCVHNELCISKPGTMKRIPASAQHAPPRNSFGERDLQLSPIRRGRCRQGLSANR